MENCKTNSNRFICNSNRLLCLQYVVVVIERKLSNSNRLQCTIIDSQRMINELNKLSTNCINASSVITSKIKLTDISQGQV